MPPNQGMKDGVLDFVTVGHDHLTFRLGLQWHEPLRPALPPDSLLPARYVRLQVASPPPRRVDGTRWDDGLVVAGGGRFDRAEPPADGRVDPLHGVAPLRQPDPGTIVLDRWLAVPAVPPTRALTRTFAMGAADPDIGPLSFLSVPYPEWSIDGRRLDVAGVDYYCEGRIDWDRRVDGGWIAVSLDRFFPPERASADYIVQVTPEGAEPPRGPTFPVTPAWTTADPGATSATRSSPGSR